MNLPSESNEKPWWNKPLFGEISLSERLKRLAGYFNRQELPDLALSLHDTEFKQLNKIAPTISMLDKDQYNEEFLLYISIHNQIEENKDDYKGLSKFIEILEFAIDKHSEFNQIRRIELDYQDKTLQELYDFIFEQLNNNLDILVFRENVHQKIEDLISTIDNKPTHDILKTYSQALDSIIKDQIGLNLLLLFKKYKIADYEILEICFNILQQMMKEDLQNLKALVLLVKVNFEQLESIGKLIGLPSEYNEAMIYSKMLQYIALSYKYKKLNFRFHQLLEYLVKWKKHYQNIVELRLEYPSYQYKLPDDFSTVIPGENVYLKYKDYLEHDE